MSAIAKSPAEGAVEIRDFGIVGDMVADVRVHGGPDMAVHQYPRDHYSWWEEALGPHPLLSNMCAFGENLVGLGMTENDVCIGDRFRLGTALLEISQPRQPCWKVEHRFGSNGMVAAIITSHRSGWYYRVLENGTARPGDILQCVERGHENWPVARLFAKTFDPGHKASRQEMREICQLERLSKGWRTKVSKALDSQNSR